MEPVPVVYKLLESANDLANGSMKEIEVNFANFDQKILSKMKDEADKAKVVKILLVKQKNKFYAISSRCSHYGAPLANGVLYKDRVRCQWHGAAFNITTGDIEDYPGVNCLPKFEVTIGTANDVYLTTTLARLLDTLPSSAKPEETCMSDTIRKKIVIIGSGSAGLICAEKLKNRSDLFEVTILTKELHPPYDRPKLSKALNSKISAITLRDEEYLKVLK
jgi:nitrite reductase/ring-hydroxylating ferredoxin subunit